MWIYSLDLWACNTKGSGENEKKSEFTNCKYMLILVQSFIRGNR